jgi:hypothetical protein
MIERNHSRHSIVNENCVNIFVFINHLVIIFTFLLMFNKRRKFCVSTTSSMLSRVRLWLRQKSIMCLMFVWINRKSMQKWRWWIFDDEINTSLTRFDSCAFAWLNCFQFWINCHEILNVFWKSETTARRSFYVCFSFNTRFKIVFICHAMSFWNFCSSSNCRFALCSRFQRKASWIKRVCVLSK